MISGSSLKAHGSGLMAKRGLLAMEHEPRTINNRLINWFIAMKSCKLLNYYAIGAIRATGLLGLVDTWGNWTIEAIGLLDYWGFAA